MKKNLFLLLVFALAFGQIKAQDYDLLKFYAFPETDTIVMHRNITEMSDGSLLLNTEVRSFSSTGVENIGPWLTKVARPVMAVTDRAEVDEVGYPTENYLLAPLPPAYGDRYLLAKTVPDETKQCTYLELLTFDLDLDNQVRIVNVEFEDNYVCYQGTRYLLDGDNIVMLYNTNGISPFNPSTEIVFCRTDLEGNVVDRSRYALTDIPFVPSKIRLWNESPKQYMVSGMDADGYFHYSIIDSQFNFVDDYSFNRATQQDYQGDYYYFEPEDENCVLPYDDDTYLLASRYRRGWYGSLKGPQLAKRDRQSHENLQISYYNTGSNNNCDVFIGLEKALDGHYFLASSRLVSENGILVSEILRVEKLDAALNLVWERLCHMDFYSYGGPTFMNVLSDGGVAFYGNGYNFDGGNPFLFILALDENGAGMPETEAFVRPYACWPNPAQDQLHLQYSPDVKPTRVELYDLQDRLVHSQSDGLESVDLRGLASGQYLMKVTLQDGKSYMDKVMNE